MLLARNLLMTLRNKMVLASKIGQSIIVGTIVAIIWNNISQHRSGIQDRIGLIFMSCANPIMAAITTVILTFADERKVFTRERSNQLYSVGAYYFTKSLMDIPVLVIGNSLFGLILYLSAGLNEVYSYKYFVYLGLINFASLCGSAFGYFLGTLAKSKEALTMLNPMITIPLLVLSGFFTNNSNYAPYLLPFYYISPFRYGFETFVLNEFNTSQEFYCNQEPNCSPLTLYSFPTTMGEDLAILAGVTIFFHILAFFMLYKFGKISV